MVCSKTKTLMADALNDCFDVLHLDIDEALPALEPETVAVVAGLASELFRARFAIMSQAFLITDATATQYGLVPYKNLR